MVKHPKHPPSPVLTRKPHIDRRFACLRVVRNARWGNLLCLELDTKKLFEFQLIQIVVDNMLGLLLGKHITLRLEVKRLRTILLNEGLKNLNGKVKELLVRLLVLLHEFIGKCIVLIFKLWVDLAVILEEKLLLLLNILG